MKTISLLFVTVLTCMQLSAQTWDWTKPEPNGISVGPYPDDENDVVTKVVTDSAGNVYELGHFTDSLYLSNNFIKTGKGGFIAKYNAAGILKWYRTIEPSGGTLGYSNGIVTSDIVLNSTGIYIAGTYDPRTAYNDPDHCTTSTYQYLTYNIAGSTLNTTPGDMGLYFAKLDLNGISQWTKTGNDYRNLSGLCTNAGIIGGTAIALASDKNSNVSAAFTWIAQRDGDFTFGGDSYSVSLANGVGDNTNNLVVIKFNSSGQRTWYNYAYQNGSYTIIPTYIKAKSITTNSLGDIYMDCITSDSTLFGNALFRTSGVRNPNSLAYTTSVLVKISAAGSWVFEKEVANFTTYLYSNDNSVQNLAVDNSNNVYMLENVSGANNQPGIIEGDTLTGSTQNFLVKYDINGNYKWKKHFGCLGDGYAGGIYCLNNKLYLSGNLYSYASKYLDFAPLTVPASNTSGSNVLDYFVAKADTSGKFTWVESFSGPSNLTAQSVAVSGTNIYIAGSYRMAITSLGHLNGFTNPNGAIENQFLGKLKDQYIRVGAVTPTNIIPGCTITVPFTSTGLTFSNSNTFTAELSNSNGDFTTPTAIGNVTSTGTGTITATIPASLTYGSGFRVRIHSSDTLKTGFRYYAYADTNYKLSLVCPAPSSGFATTNITGTAATVNWAAVGCAAGYRVQYRVKGTTLWTTKNVSTNTPTLTITGLSPNTIYQWRVATKCINSGTVSFSAFSTTKQFTTLAATVIPATGTDKLTTGENVQLYLQPNPVKSIATLIIKGTVSNAGITITDLAGKILWKQDGVNSNRILLPAANFAAGVYIVKLVNGNEIKVVQMVKE